MSKIRSSSSERIWKLEKFLGLNENPDGDTKLKLGEASICRNWRVTRDRNLQRRPAFHTKYDIGTGKKVSGMWFGNIKGTEIGLAASGGHMWLFYEGDYLEELKDLGMLETENNVNFFAYNDIVYIQNGEEYYSYDGARFGIVKGYRPLVITGRDPSGADGELLEEVNKLNGMRRVWFSPDGVHNEFLLPESDLLSVDYVKYNATGEYMNPKLYSFDRFNGIVTFEATETFAGDGETTEFTLTNDLVSSVTVKVGDTTTSVTFDSDAGTITFATAPADEAVITVSEVIMLPAGTNTIEIGYSAPSTYRMDIARMTNSELFLGAQDNAVFLYGNGTNKAVYSSIDYNGVPRADYFPDLNEMAVADANTPITALIRHYSQLICFKTNAAYSVQYGMIQEQNGNDQWGFYVKPINKSIGNVAVGQVRLVNNSPLTLHGNDLYEWHNTSSYSSNLSVDERQARVISQRIYDTLGSFDFSECFCYDDNDNQEYYIWCGNKALVFNYAADAWYVYTGREVRSMCNAYSDVLCGTADGKIMELTTKYFNDDGDAIDSYWESGSIDFGKAYARKLLTEVWVGTKPQEQSFVTVTVMTDKKPDYTEKNVFGHLATFLNMDFSAFSFSVNRKPQVKKLKIKAKKFAFLKFVLKTKDLHTTATVLLIDPKIRETGFMK